MRAHFLRVPESETLDTLTLTFSKKELDGYVALRCAGLTRKSKNWLLKAAAILWGYAKGEVTKASADALRLFVVSKYQDVNAQRKVINFAKAFLRYLSKTRFDSRYQAFNLFLELPRALKEQKNLTTRIVTKSDISNVLGTIERAYENGDIDYEHRINFRAIVIFGAFTGQRPYSTVGRLTVGQFREALKKQKPVVAIPPDCDKIRMSHYCPLAPPVVQAVQALINGQRDDTLIFDHLPFEQWLRQARIKLVHSNVPFQTGDLRKFAEQHGDIIQWESSNRAYILTHGVSGVDWTHYKHPLPDSVYDVYMKYWADVSFTVC